MLGDQRRRRLVADARALPEMSPAPISTASAVVETIENDLALLSPVVPRGVGLLGAAAVKYPPPSGAWDYLERPASEALRGDDWTGSPAAIGPLKMRHGHVGEVAGGGAGGAAEDRGVLDGDGAVGGCVSETTGAVVSGAAAGVVGGFVEGRRRAGGLAERRRVRAGRAPLRRVQTFASSFSVPLRTPSERLPLRARRSRSGSRARRRGSSACRAPSRRAHEVALGCRAGSARVAAGGLLTSQRGPDPARSRAFATSTVEQPPPPAASALSKTSVIARLTVAAAPVKSRTSIACTPAVTRPRRVTCEPRPAGARIVIDLVTRLPAARLNGAAAPCAGRRSVRSATVPTST